VADTGYQGAGPAVRVRRRRLDPDTGRYRALSDNQKEVNTPTPANAGPANRRTHGSKLEDPPQYPV